jgi:hypothetical protein
MVIKASSKTKDEADTVNARNRMLNVIINIYSIFNLVLSKGGTGQWYRN